MNKFSRYLIDEPALQVLPTAAKYLGVNEAIILQQMQYWLSINPHEKDGERWIYNTYKSWAQQMPWMSDRYIQKLIIKLESDGFIITGNFNDKKYDRTKWYRINYEKIDQVCYPGNSQCYPGNIGTQPEQQPIPETTHRLTTETNNTTANGVPLADSSAKKTHVESPIKSMLEGMRLYMGFPDRITVDPIPNYGKEGKAIKRMLSRGFTPRQIILCWRAKVDSRKEYVSMVYVNEDIGKAPIIPGAAKYSRSARPSKGEAPADILDGATEISGGEL
jgi:hypothetical protein